MTLLEVLIKKLPECAGWPKDADRCIYHEHKEGATFYDAEGDMVKNGVGFIDLCIPDVRREEVTREQYESALGGSKPEWDGEGLPPVGADVQCICNQFPNEGQEKLLGKILYSGEYTILHTYKTNEQHHVPVESVLMTKHWSITPIRSEADKKREIGVLSLARADQTVGRFEYGEKMSDGRLIGYAWYELYDKIAAGEVTGIRID